MNQMHQFVYIHTHTYLLSGESRGFDGNSRGSRGIEIEGIGVRNRRRSRGLDVDLQHINIPQDPILCGSPMRDIVRHGVPPRWEPPIGPQKVPVTGLKLHLRAVPHGLPLHGGVQPPRHALHHLAPRHTQ